MSDDHRFHVFVLVVFLMSAVGAASPAAPQSARNNECSDWRVCRELALAAAERGQYETFHDLAWKTLQAGPPKDPALMDLLARAQSLSGRPYDALIMLERLVDMHVAVDAATNEDFSLTRQLPGWPRVAARIEQLSQSPPPVIAAPVPEPARAVAPARSAAPGRGAAPARAAASPPAVPRVAPPVPPAAAEALPPAFVPAPVTEAVRFSAEPFVVSGLAYDAVSQRFLFGDRLGRKLFVVADGANHIVDLVRSDSAGFREIAAVEIDTRRGDLWVASTGAEGAGTLHKLQLVSGRPLKTYGMAAGLDPLTSVDLAVTPAGVVLMLDSVGRQLLTLPSGGTSVERLMRIDVQDPMSVAVGDDDRFAYLAHRDGVSRIDLRAKTAALLSVPHGVSIARLERIRTHRNSLIAVAVDVDGSRRILRLDLNTQGSAIAKATTLEMSLPGTGEVFLTISDNALLYMSSGADAATSRATARASNATEFVAYRIPLR